MKYLKHSWLQTSQNKYTINYLFLQKEILVDSNKKNSIEYYKKIIKKVALLSEKGIKTIIVLPDIYLSFFRNLYRVSEQTIDEYSSKNLKYKLENLKIFCKNIISLDNVSIYYKLTFDNIISISKIINKRKKEEVDNNVNTEYISFSKTSIMDYNDLIYTQEIDLSEKNENKERLSLFDNLNDIYNEFIYLFYVSGLVFENVFYSFDKKIKQDILDLKKILYDNLLLFKKKNNTKILLYNNKETLKTNLIDNNVFDDIFLEQTINDDFLKSFYDMDRLIKLKYIPVYNFNLFLESKSFEKIFKLEQMLLIIQKIFLVPKNIAFFPLQKYKKDNFTNVISVLNYDDIVNKFIFDFIIKRSFDFNFLISKKVRLLFFKNFFLKKEVFRIKLFVDDQKIEIAFNLSNKSIKLNKNKVLAPYEVKVLD
ncbi:MULTISPECIES: hypothetical protein [unclassified Mycoplasma]|uniref:hypothetical protein n=1 Tax=unclassified Mycoplasma TaxID=2683645 RepID=UPI00197B7C15|nr:MULTISPECIES: hypothetical protein [unclassified Mycoplasma]MBN4084538.1 hypothetical protein [Mycoplasma sp. CSL10166]MBU4693016.1 hypothetical protein [Mycoplasma sp. CSL7491-lung]